jgi:NADH-quinone oxidoreductase subunit J
VTLGAAWSFGDEVTKNAAAPTPVAEQVENTAALGSIIYTDYIFIFQMSGIILLVAMIGAIVLTHRERAGVKRQNIAKQSARRPEDAYELVDVEVGKGVALPTKKG